MKRVDHFVAAVRNETRESDASYARIGTGLRRRA